jgi:YD repeat-containing protein
MAINTKGAGTNNRFASGVTGEVTLQLSALALDCPAGPQISCDLTYRSMDSSVSSPSLGPGWTFGYDISVVRINATQVKVIDGGGREDLFTLQPDGNYTCDGMFRSGRFGVDRQTFTLTFADQGKWVFRPLDGSPGQGKISSIRCRNNVALTCAYNASGLLSSVSSAFDQSLTFTHGGGGEITRVADHTGRFCDFTYSGGSLASVSSPQIGGQPPVAGPTTFTYTSGFADPRRNGNLLRCEDGAGRLHGAFTYADQADSRAVDYDCVVSSRRSDSPEVPTATTTYTAESGGVMVLDCDELGLLTETLCDAQHRLVQMHQFTGFCVAGTPVTSSSNRPTGQLRVSDPAFYETTCTYNSQHCPLVITGPDGLQSRNTYAFDLKGAACPVIERGNLIVCTLRDPGGEERTVTMAYLPGFGSPEPGASKMNCANGTHIKKATLRVIPAGGGGTTGPKQKAWLCSNFRTSLTTSLGQKFTNSFGASGNLIACRTPISGAGCDMTYNSLGQLTSVTTLNGPGSSFTDAFTYDATSKFCSSVISDPTGLSLTESYVRDPLGRPTGVTDPRGFTTSFSYNVIDLCVSSQSPLVGTTAASPITTRYFYDAGGLLSRCDVEHRDATGALSATNPDYSTVYLRTSSTSPFAISRIAEENRPVDLPAGSTDIVDLLASFDVCDFTYDACGRLTETRVPAASLAQPVDQVCSFQYDEIDRLHRSYMGGLGTPGAVITECDYTLAGDLARCATLAPPPGESPTEIYTYDGFQRPVSITDPMGNLTFFSYDNRGYGTSSLFGELDDVPGSTGNVLLETIKARVHIGTIGHVDHGRYDKGKTGHVSLIKREIAPSGIVPGPLFHAINTKGAGSGNRMANSKHPDLMRSASPFFDVCIEDDITTVDRFTPGSATAPVQEITTCDYSPAGLLLGVSTNGDSLLACSYDSAGRNTVCADGTCSVFLTLDACDNATSSIRTDFSSSGGASKSFTTSAAYDSLGRCIQSTEGGNVTTCDFDSLDRLTRCTPPTGAAIFHDYDGGGPVTPFSVRTRCDVDGNGSLETMGSSYSRGGGKMTIGIGMGKGISERAGCGGNLFALR